MSLVVDKKTGEVAYSHVSKFAHKTIARKGGSMIVQNYGLTYDEKTREMVLKPTDKTDLQAYIDSFAEETGVYNILKKFAKTGDVSLLNAREGYYADISQIPVDQLNPQKMVSEASKSAKVLSDKLGVQLTAEKLATMSSEELSDLITKAVTAKIEASKKSSEVKKEGAENA